MCDLRLLKNRQRFAFKKGLRYRITCRTLRNILSLKYCSKATSKLDPFFWGPAVKERYKELVDRRSCVCRGGA
eukprot:1312436-Ditylum_brightwellii.AAC.1